MFHYEINNYLNSVLQWTVNNSLSVNTSKTKGLTFDFSENQNQINIVFNTTPIEIVRHYRCLGVVLDCGLSFNNHIDIVFG